MQRVAVEKARLRLAKAEAASSALASAASLGDIESAWVDFLLAFGGIYSMLVKGAKGFAASEIWFSEKLHERRSDPFLQYLLQARNAEEHGIAPTIDSVETAHETWIRKDEQWQHLNTIFVSLADKKQFNGHSNEAIVEVVDENKNPVESKVYIYHSTKLLTVRDGRSGKLYVPPTEFLDLSSFDRNPKSYSRAAVPYLQNLVSEAEALIIS